MKNFPVHVNQQPNGVMPHRDTAAHASTTAVIQSELTGLAEFNARANIERFQKNPQTFRLLYNRPLGNWQIARRRASVDGRSPVGMRRDLEQADLLDVAGADAITSLRHTDTPTVARQLESNYDLLELQALLQTSLRQVDQMNATDAQKNEMRKKLNGMMRALMERHGPAIEKGLKEKEEFEIAIGKMERLQGDDGGSNKSSLFQEIRNVQGAKGKGKNGTSLTPIVLVELLREKVGSRNFGMALRSLRKESAAGMRPRDGKKATDSGPRLWLSMSEASSFDKVQSTYAVAEELRSDLSHRAGVMPQADPLTTTALLLACAEPGIARADGLAPKIVAADKLNSPQKAKAYGVLHQAVGKLPLHLWHQDRLSLRMELMDDLKVKMREEDEKSPRASSQEERLEQTLRGAKGKYAAAR